MKQLAPIFVLGGAPGFGFSRAGVVGTGLIYRMPGKDSSTKFIALCFETAHPYSMNPCSHEK